MQVIYENHNGLRFNLTKWPVMLQDIESLLGHTWQHSATGNEKRAKISAFYKPLEERELTLSIFADNDVQFTSTLNTLHRVFEEDITDVSPGKLIVGEYYLKCYITTAGYEEYEEDFEATDIKLTVSAERWIWIKESRVEYLWHQTTDTAGRGYNYGYDYDYTMGNGNIATIQNTHFAPCDFVLKISGYVRNPAVTIGNHIYRINEVVQKNEILTIDTRNKTITLTKNNGVQVNAYSKRDKANYIFEPILAGEQRLYWNSNFNLEIILYEERSEPLWT